MSIRTKPKRPHADWKGDLQRLLNVHNETHATRQKVIAHSTREARAEGLFRCFRLLRAAGFRTGPASIGGNHVEFLVRYWVADPSIEADLRKRGSELRLRDSPLSAAYVQQHLSFLRTLCTWVGKPGLVLPARRYVNDPSLVSRVTVAQQDRTWSGAAVDRMAVLKQVEACDPVVGLQLEVMMAFGLRRKEAVMFSPALSEVPAAALPANAQPGQYLAFVRIKRGTKGGRVRFTAIRNDEQRRALERALRAAPHPGQHIGKPGQDLKKALDRFTYVLRRCKVTQREMGVTGHGLRHEFAADLYFELAEVPAPIKGGPTNISRELMDAAYAEVAAQLGHGRKRITGAYLGGTRTVVGASAALAHDVEARDGR